jgi:hypothetical protein
MKSIEAIQSQITTTRPLPVAGRIYALGAAAAAVGVITFIIGAAGPAPADAWRALLINFCFWGSAAAGAFIWAATFRIARASWSAPINRLGHALLWYLGCFILVYLLLYFGRHYYLPWIDGRGVGDRGVWLNAPFLFLRDGLGLLALFICAFFYVRAYTQSDRLDSNAQTHNETEIASIKRRVNALAVILAILYALTFTLIGFDMVMSLIPIWHSALFGWYFLLGGMYVGMAALIIMTLALRRWLGIEAILTTKHRQDLGNLLMAFAMLMTYFFYSQALVIWYENLPPETIFPIPRLHYQPWRTLSLILLFTCYLGVFALLVIREMKENKRTLLGVAIFAFLSVWLERYLLIAPSLTPRGTSTIAILEILLIGVGFFGVAVLTITPVLARTPALSRIDLDLIVDRESMP